MRKLALFLLIIGYWLLAVPQSIQAACGCAVGSPCAYVRPDTTGFSYDYKYREGLFEKTVKVYCDTKEEADSVFATRAPICGSTSEIAPHCAIMINPENGQRNPSQLTCYGAEFSYAEQSSPGISKDIPENTLRPVSGTIKFAGKTYTGVGQVLWCNSVAFCCARSDIACEAPSTTYPPFKEPVNPLPEWAVLGAKELPICAAPSGAGESRIFIPHLRNISALATLLQTMFNPLPSLFKNNVLPVPAGKTASSSVTAQDTVTSKVYFHQGLDDNTQYVSADNNSSLKVGVAAPAPLYSFTGGNVYKQNGLCSITETKYNPGDDLLGPTIKSGLLYTQKYTYTARPKPVVNGQKCLDDNKIITQGQRDGGLRCCSEVPANGFQVVDIKRLPGAPKGPGETRYQCGTAQEYREKTKGQIAVFTKTPLIEYIYDVLVVGENSVFKRLMPQGLPSEIKEIPSQANYSVKSDGTSLAVAGKSGDKPTLYFPHVGSLKEYFLDGIQKALRPFSGTLDTAPQAGQCGNFSIPAVEQSINTASIKYGVPGSLLNAIFEIESAPYIANPNSYSCQTNNVGAAGVMQITTDTYKLITCSNEQLDNDIGVCAQTPGKLSRCVIADNVELAARTLLSKVGKWNYGICAKTSNISPTDKATIYKAVNNYYGSCNPDGLTSKYVTSVAMPSGRKPNYGDIILDKLNLVTNPRDYPTPQCGNPTDNRQ